MLYNSNAAVNDVRCMRVAVFVNKCSAAVIIYINHSQNENDTAITQSIWYTMETRCVVVT